MFTNVLTLNDCTFPSQTNYDGCYHNIGCWLYQSNVIMLKHENFQSVLSSKTTNWSHVLNITHFPCNCILFTKV